MRRDDVAVVGDRRVVDGHLQRRGQQVALADRQVDRVARLPKAVDAPSGRVGLPGEGPAQPSRCRHETGGLAGNVDPGRVTVAQPPCPILELGALAQVEVVADLVEVGVGRLHDGLGQVDRTVAVGVPVVPHQTVVHVRSAGKEGGRGAEHAGLQAGDRVDGLEGRAGRVLTRDRAVEQWIVGLRAQELRIVPGTDAAREPARVVGGVVGHRQQSAGVGVHDDGGSGGGLRIAGGVRQGDARLDGLLGRPLHPRVDRQDEVVAGLRQAAAGQHTLSLAEGVDLDSRDAVRAPQPPVVGGLNPALTDLVVGQVPLEPGLFELPGIDLPQVAQDRRGQIAQRVGAQVALLHLDAREGLIVLEQVGDQRPAGVALDDHQVVGQPRLPGDERADRLCRHVDEAGEPRRQRRELAGRHVHGADAYGKTGPVVDEHSAAAVFDHSARRHDLDAAHAVVLGLGQVLLAAQDLQEPESKDQYADQHDGKAGEHGHPQRHRGQPQRPPTGPAVANAIGVGVCAPQSRLPHVTPPEETSKLAGRRPVAGSAHAKIGRGFAGGCPWATYCPQVESVLRVAKRV